jgi:putative aldouronate transport system permease protein
MLYPMLHVVSLSFSGIGPIDAGAVTFYPKGFNIDGYRYMLKDQELIRAYGWTVAYALGGSVLMLLVTSLVAYPLSHSNFILKKHVTVFYAITMFISGGLIPTFELIKNLHLFNTYWVMVLPGCVSAYNVFVFRSFFQSIPASLGESARVDGANDLYIWARIILPLSKALLATFFLFAMVSRWNAWFNALLYITDKNRYPLQMVLRRLIITEDIGNNFSADMTGIGITLHAKNAQNAAVVLTMLPILAIYPFIQKHFAKGVMIGAIKG